MPIDPEVRKTIARQNRDFILDHDAIEKAAVENWARKTNRLGQIIRLKPDPPDFRVGNELVELAECLEPDRKRDWEYKQQVRDADAGIPHQARAGLDLATVMRDGAKWVICSVLKKKKKYHLKRKDSRDWILVVYVNCSWTDRIDWLTVKDHFVKHPPPFRAVHAYHDTGKGPQVEVLFNKRRKVTNSARLINS